VIIGSDADATVATRMDPAGNTTTLDYASGRLNQPTFADTLPGSSISTAYTRDSLGKILPGSLTPMTATGRVALIIRVFELHALTRRSYSGGFCGTEPWGPSLA
jgi:hypothetical protein